MRTRKPPAPVGTDVASSTSDQVTVTVGPAADAAVAVGRTPSTGLASSCFEAWPSATSSLASVVRIELPEGVSRLFASIAIPSVSRSASATVYLKRCTAPAPWAIFHSAHTLSEPIASIRRGFAAPAAVTVTVSLKVTATPTVSPMPWVPSGTAVACALNLY